MLLCRELDGSRLYGTLPKSIANMNKLTTMYVIIVTAGVVTLKVAMVAVGSPMRLLVYVDRANGFGDPCMRYFLLKLRWFWQE